MFPSLSIFICKMELTVLKVQGHFINYKISDIILLFIQLVVQRLGNCHIDFILFRVSNHSYASPSFFKHMSALLVLNPTFATNTNFHVIDKDKGQRKILMYFGIWYQLTKSPKYNVFVCSKASHSIKLPFWPDIQIPHMMV